MENFQKLIQDSVALLGDIDIFNKDFEELLCSDPYVLDRYRLSDLLQDFDQKFFSLFGMKDINKDTVTDLVLTPETVSLIIKVLYPEGIETEFLNVYPEEIPDLLKSELVSIGTGSIVHAHPKKGDIIHSIGKKIKRDPFVHLGCGSFVFATFSKKKYVMISARSLNHLRYGGKLDCGIGGNVGAGQSVRQSIADEFFEELQIKVPEKIEHLLQLRHANKAEDNSHELLSVVELDTPETTHLLDSLGNKGISYFVLETSTEFMRYLPDTIEKTTSKSIKDYTDSLHGENLVSKEMAYTLFVPLEELLDVYNAMKNEDMERLTNNFAWISIVDGQFFDGNFLGDSKVMEAVLEKYISN